MGWQARLPKDQKPEFKRTCNKCGDTGVKKTFVSVNGVPQRAIVQCKCSILPPVTVEPPAEVPASTE